MEGATERERERESEATRARRRVCLAQLVHSLGRDNEDIVSDAGRKAETVCAAKESFFKSLLQSRTREQDGTSLTGRERHVIFHSAPRLLQLSVFQLWLIKSRPRRGDGSGLPNLSKQPSKKKKKP